MDTKYSPNEEDEALSEINITPLIDVSLVMVIIFMVTAPFFIEPDMKVNTPEAVTGEAAEQENITISISEDGKWAVNETRLLPENIPLLLAEKIDSSKLKRVVIKADRQALNEHLLYAMDISKKCGAKKISLAVKQRQRTI